jgi:hypothetical protein
MKRVVVAAIVALVGGCGMAEGEPVTFPADRVELVAAYQVHGGLASFGTLAIAAPNVLVYSDGQVVSGASRVLTLAQPDLAQLVRDLRRDLAGLDRDLMSPQSRRVLDAPSELLVVRRGDGSLQSVDAYALGIADDYPRGLRDAAGRLGRLAERAGKTGTAYTSDRVRLVLAPPGQTTGDVPPWPAGIAEPPEGDFSLRTADLEGDAARRVAATLPADVWRAGGEWSGYRLRDGSVYRAAWRYLAPDEPVR